AGEAEGRGGHVFGDIRIAKYFQPCMDAKLTIEPTTLQQANGFDEGRRNRYRAERFRQFCIAARRANALSFEIGKRLDGIRTCKLIRRTGPARQRQGADLLEL